MKTAKGVAKACTPTDLMKTKTSPDVVTPPYMHVSTLV